MVGGRGVVGRDDSIILFIALLNGSLHLLSEPEIMNSVEFLLIVIDCKWTIFLENILHPSLELS